MLLRTYPLITHPAFIAHVEKSLLDRRQLSLFPTEEVPEHLPKLNKIADIAEYLKISPYLIRDMVSRKARHYRQFEVRKRSGDLRTISAPRTFLKVTQWWILDCILEQSIVPSFVHGFVKGKSFLTNAQAHIGSHYVLNVDIKDFFPSIGFSQTRKVFSSFGYKEGVCIGLSELTTIDGGLPQGAPSSPMIANLAFAEADTQLAVFSEMNGLKYTRYADDLTFSSLDRIPTSFLLDIKAVLSKSNLQLNDKKTRFMGRNQRKEVTGLIVTEAGVRLSRDHLNRLRGWFHRLIFSPKGQLDNLDRIRGNVNLLEQIGGAGSHRVLELGRRAVREIEQAAFRSATS